MENKRIEAKSVRDKSHDEALVKWAEFVKANPREKWKPQVNMLVDAVYEKSREFYERLGKTEEGREILKRLKAERLKR